MNHPRQLEFNRALEWDRLLEFACSKAFTEPGKTRLQQLQNPEQWASDLNSARTMQLETQEITPLLDRDALWSPLIDLHDPSAPIDRLSRGGILEVTELAELRRWLYAVACWSQIPREEIRGDRFKRTLTQLSDPLNILRILEQILTPEGELSEKASPKLTSLYSEIRSVKREIANVLDQLVKTYSQKGFLQEEFTDIRDGRYVLPIKTSHQNEIEGNIYEASASRQTVFVEPKEVAALNNRLRQRQNELLQEIFVVLESTSQRLQPFTPEIAGAIDTLTHWDAVQAKARLGRHYSGKPIRVVEERCFSLKQTAHPLLWWAIPTDSIIRNEIDFGDPVRSLLLTGPNTGGKTVLLKTLGLAGISARTGFPFPATDHPTVPFFDRFFADLGDPQSIQNHLSSFSGHVFRFKEILENLSDRSLILIDELNSATDPEEGAAFGRAVLETILSQNAMIVTTTHDPHLKALALTDPRILNSSMTFDETARSPTYKMILGVPGRSRALETAERLGIPMEVIQLAKKYLSREHLEFEKLLSQLEFDIQTAARAKKEALVLKEEAEQLKKEWMTRTETSVQDMMDKTRQKLRRILEQAQDEVRASVKKLEEVKNQREINTARLKLNETLSQTYQQSAQRVQAALQEEAPDIAKLIHPKMESTDPSPESPAFSSSSLLQIGASVRIPKWKNTGTILEISGSRAKVAMGTLQMSLLTHELELISNPPPLSRSGATQVKAAGPSFSPPAEIDLRGERFEDAMSALGAYLDQTFRSGSHVEITIIHGLGTGALREGTRKLLNQLPYIKAFRNGGVGHGGAGATIVEFDRS